MYFANEEEATASLRLAASIAGGSPALQSSHHRRLPNATISDAAQQSPPPHLQGTIRGSVTVIMIFALPLFVFLLCMILDFGRVIKQRANLMVALDRSAEAGAAAIAHGLDEISRQNNKLRQAWQDLEGEFNSGSQKDKDEAKQQIAVYESRKNEAIENIEKVLSTLTTFPEKIAADTLKVNSSEAEPEIKLDVGFNVSDSLDYEKQHGTVSHDHITGPVFSDPSSHEDESYKGLKFLMKQTSPDASIVLRATQEIGPLYLSKFIERSNLTISSSSAAKAFGGSVEDNKPYHYSLVPMWSVDSESQNEYH